MKINVTAALVLLALAYLFYSTQTQHTERKRLVNTQAALTEVLPDDAPFNFSRGDIKPIDIEAQVLTPVVSIPTPTYHTVNPELQGKYTFMEDREPQFRSAGFRNKLADPDAVAAYADKPQDQSGANKLLVSSFNAGGQAANVANTGGFLNIPADPHGAAGPNHLVNVFNVSIEFYNKDGTGGSSSSLQNFFAPLAPVNLTFDPKVLYDQFEDRWVVVTLQRTDTANGDPANTSNVFVAVSATSDPNGAWFMASINTLVNISGADRWFDYPGLAVDEEVIYLTGNMFGFGGGGGVGSRLWIIDKADFYVGNPPVVLGPINPYAGAGANLTTQPAHVYGATPPNFGTYLMSYSGLSNGVTEAWQWVRLDNPLGAISFTQGFTSVGDIEALTALLPTAPQAGTSTDTSSSFTVATNDRRALDAVWRNGRVYSTATIDSQLQPGETSASWISLNADGVSGSVTLDEFGIVDGEDIAPGTFTFFPSIAVNLDGGIGLGFSASAPTLNPGSYYTYKSTTDPANTMRAARLLRTGTDFYYRTFGSGNNRWGDYSAMVVDPNDECFWVYNKHATTRGIATGPDEDGVYLTAYGEVCNDEPSGVDDTAVVDENQTVTTVNGGDTSVLDNDSDGDADDTLMAVLVSSPADASSFTLNPNGTFSYAHNGDEDSTDSFTYNACDDGTPAKCNLTTVNININPIDDAPTAVADTFTLLENAAATTIDVLVNDTDPDAGPMLVASVTQPTDGTVVITNGGADLTYQPDNNYCNDGSPTDDFTYTLNGGSSATVAVTVTCVDQPPVAVADSPSVGEDSGATTFDVQGNDTDPDGGTNTVDSVTQPSNGAVVITNGGADLTYQPDLNYCNDGTPTDDFTYTLNGGSSATVAVTVTCVDDDPVAVADVASVGEDSGANTIDVQNNDTDVDGGVNTINSITQPSNGTAVITNAGADLTYQPDLNYCNDGTPTDDFTYTLNGGSSTTVAVTVTCVSDDPVAVADTPSVAEDSGATTLDVQANDTDPDGGANSITSVTQPANGTVVITNAGADLTYQPDLNYCNDGTPTDDFTYTLNGGSSTTVAVTVTCVNDDPVAVTDVASVGEDSGATTIDVQNNDTDVDGGSNTIDAVTQPANGTVVITNGGADLTYQPDLNYCNDGTPTDDFSYTLNGGSSTTVAVTVTCVDDNPVAVADGPSVGEDSGANTIDVQNNDTDVDGGTNTIDSVTQPGNGTVVITNAGADLTYQPNLNYCNGGTTTDDFTYTLNGGSSATVAVTVTCVDDTPVAVADGPSVGEDSGANTIDVQNNDTDVDGGTNTIDSVTQPGNGTVVITNAGADLTYQPDLNYCNDGTTTDDFTYTLNGGSSTTVAVTVTCVDDGPVAVSDGATVGEDSGANTIDVQGNDTDVDGGSNTINAVTQPANGTVVITNAGVDLSYQPNLNYCNDGTTTDDFTYTLNGGSSTTVAVTVNCVDDSPTAVADSRTVSENSGPNSIDVQANDTDVDGGSNSITAVTQPTNGTVVITNAGADLSYQPDADYCNDGLTTDDFTYTLNGGSSAGVAITVNCIDLPPLAVADTATVTEDSGANTINVQGNDIDVDGGSNSITAVTQPVNGTVVITNAGADLSYQPDLNYCNDGSPTDDFSYTLNGGSSATVAVTVTCFDDPPVAVSDVATVGEDSGASILNVQANDIDVDGGTNTINAVSQPANGTVVITNGGADLSYQPDLNYCHGGGATDDFTYTLNGGSSTTVAITVNCVDDSPVAVDDGPIAVDEDSGVNNIAVIGNDTDVDGGPLGIIAVGAASNGTTGQSGNMVDYSPDADYCGPDSFTYTLNGGSTATVSIMVNCLGDDPVAVADTGTVAEDSGATIIDVQSNDTDPDGGSNQVVSVTQPTNGVVVITNAGADLSYQPNVDYCNDGVTTDDFTYSLNGGSSASVAVTVTCVNDEPAMTVNPAVYINLADIGSPPAQQLACLFDFGPDDEDVSQAVNDMLVTIQNDANGILNSIDVDNTGALSYSFSGNAGVAEVSVTLQDDGGTAAGGDDTSVAYTFRVNVQDYVFRSNFEVDICQ